jgi:hypothetical protein
MGGWRGKGGTGVAELSRPARKVEEEAGEENEGETPTVAHRARKKTLGRQFAQ